MPTGFEQSNALDNPAETTPGDVFAAFLRCRGEASYVGEDDPWPAYSEVMPDLVNSPPDLIVCTTTTPVNQGALMTSGRTVQKMGIQVRVSAGSDPSAYRKAAAIRASISEAPSVSYTVVDSVTYEVHRAKLDSGPARLPPTSSDRYGYVLNYTVALLAAKV